MDFWYPEWLITAQWTCAATVPMVLPPGLYPILVGRSTGLSGSNAVYGTLEMADRYVSQDVSGVHKSYTNQGGVIVLEDGAERENSGVQPDGDADAASLVLDDTNSKHSGHAIDCTPLLAQEFTHRKSFPTHATSGRTVAAIIKMHNGTVTLRT
ncbi:hypothetical protein BU23DRAFT_233009 [Bimuria novae-zelandiae CBS 107.79]|uniref:Uncharacterized protein n=1 Tax=Bimuria novae-zelandiae CBS 107.79 TaxID=1447943 RepID=A0A6A5V3W6_9PLEO|nr:hypothetical protein BU23DRAFT_233009 [Bimuria novae-zelandiae CBS 107.79]